MDNFKDPRQPHEAAEESYKKRRIVWCSQPNWQNAATIDYYADTLWLYEIDDGQFALELKCGGTCVRLPVTDIFKYVV